MLLANLSINLSQPYPSNIAESIFLCLAPENQSKLFNQNSRRQGKYAPFHLANQIWEMFFWPPEITSVVFLPELHWGDLYVICMLLGLISQLPEILCSPWAQLNNCNKKQHSSYSSPLCMLTQKKKSSSVITVPCPRFCTMNSSRERIKWLEPCQDILPFSRGTLFSFPVRAFSKYPAFWNLSCLGKLCMPYPSYIYLGEDKTPVKSICLRMQKKQYL